LNLPPINAISPHEIGRPDQGSKTAVRKLIWGFTWFLVIGWTLVAWVGHGLVGLVTGFVGAGSAELTGFQVDPASLPGLAELTRDLGEFAIIAVWALGAFGLLAIGWLLSLFFPKRVKPAPVMVPMPGKNIGGGWSGTPAGRSPFDRPRDTVPGRSFPSAPYSTEPREADRNPIPRGSLVDRMLSRKDR
jgi:hypothetical protein